jgi:MYXO-CTERM domain-containing protein
MLGEDATSTTLQNVLDTLSSIATTENVPAMGGICLLALGLSMLGLGAVRSRRRH